MLPACRRHRAISLRLQVVKTDLSLNATISLCLHLHAVLGNRLCLRHKPPSFPVLPEFFRHRYILRLRLASHNFLCLRPYSFLPSLPHSLSMARRNENRRKKLLKVHKKGTYACTCLSVYFPNMCVFLPKALLQVLLPAPYARCFRVKR